MLPCPWKHFVKGHGLIKGRNTVKLFTVAFVQAFQAATLLVLHYLFCPDFAADLKITPHNAPFGLELRSEVLMRMTRHAAM